MACQHECNNNSQNTTCHTGNGFIILIVLYILLAIILGSSIRNNYYC